MPLVRAETIVPRGHAVNLSSNCGNILTYDKIESYNYSARSLERIGKGWFRQRPTAYQVKTQRA